MNYTSVLFLPRCNLTKLQVSCRRIMRFIDRCEMEQFSRLLFVRSSTLEEACTIVAMRMARCVTAYHARNHGITGCRSRLMSLQGVPDRIISLDGAPRELFSPLVSEWIERDAAWWAVGVRLFTKHRVLSWNQRWPRGSERLNYEIL